MLAAQRRPRTSPASTGVAPGPAPRAAVAALSLTPAVPLLLAAMSGGNAVAVATGSVVFAAVAVIAISRVSATHPHPRFGPANAVTLVRAAGAAVLLGLAAAPAVSGTSMEWACALAAWTLLALDGADGWLARRSGLASTFGARFDMEVDALLILALSVLALVTGRAGVWVLGLGLLRYAFVAAGRFLPWLARPLPASARRRAVCALVIAAQAALLAPPLQPPHSAWLAAAALGLLAWSFACDLAWLARRR